jgi:mono/diheme cytochrome c family protein
VKSWIVGFVGLLALAFLAFGCGGKPQSQQTQTPPPPGGTTVSKLPDFAAGEKVFEAYCVLCHGAGGKGDGQGGKALNPPPRDFTDRKVMSVLTDDQLKEIIKNGKGAMPAWGSTLKDEDITNVLRYIRGFAPQT